MAPQRRSSRATRATAASARSRASPSPSPPRAPEVDTQAELLRLLREEQQAMLAEHRRVMDEQRQSRDDMGRMLESIREVSVAVARLEKRPVERDTPVDTSEPEQTTVPPPVGQDPHATVFPPAVGQYVIPPPTMPEQIPVMGQTRDQDELARPRQFLTGESSGAHEHGAQHHERWDVDRFLKNGGQLFYGGGGSDPEIAIEWIDTSSDVLQHLGCPPELWVRMATGAMQGMAKLWWKTTHRNNLHSRQIERITWPEFRDLFYAQYFSPTIRSRKRMEFQALVQGELTLAEYQARFLTLERFAPGSFFTERERTERFVAGMRLSVQSVVAPFSCATLTEAAMRALEVESAHERHHLARGRVQGDGQRHRARGQA